MPYGTSAARAAVEAQNDGLPVPSHESATAAVAAGVSEDDIAAYLASLDKKPCTVYYSPFSNNSMGAAMTATACGCAELKLVDLAGEQKSDAYLQINPYGQVPGLTDDSNGLKLGESHAILRYLATPVQASLYPGNPASRARIDMCMDNFTNYVFLKCYNGSINCVIGELLGLDAWPYPADQAAANAEFVALDKWAGLYLASGPFICGEELTIADYRGRGTALIRSCNRKIKEKTNFVPPGACSQYAAAVLAKDPAAETLLTENTGSSSLNSHGVASTRLGARGNGARPPRCSSGRSRRARRRRAGSCPGGSGKTPGPRRPRRRPCRPRASRPWRRRSRTPSRARTS